MKIVLTGGGSGGHFYPLIAVVEAIEKITLEKKLIEPVFYYTGPAPFDPPALAEHDITYIPSSAGKLRRYVSILNITDVFRTVFGTMRATIQLFNIFPDVVFSTGGFASFPTMYAARLLGIPIVLYDADAVPGRVSLWSAPFVKWIALAHAEAAAAFPEKTRQKIARVGHPIRAEIEMPTKEGGHEFLKLSTDVPTLFFMGGSQGARALNETILDALPSLVERYNVIHQTGADNLTEVSNIAHVVLKDSPYAERYRVFGLLNTLALRMAAGITDLVISRAGSGTLFEIASWGIPAILVPIPRDIAHDQTENAFSYARHGACIVIEQANLAPHVLVSEIDRIMNDAAQLHTMHTAARAFARPDAARTIAQIIIDTILEHTTP